MLRQVFTAIPAMNIPRPRRLQNRDYSSPGLYFVTICVDFKRSIFGQVKNAKVEHSALGRIVEECWIGLPYHFACIKLHAHVVMPNHIHGIIEINAGGLAQHAAPLQRISVGEPGFKRASSLSVIVRSFKAEVTRRARLELSWEGNVWQYNYFDRVIRDGREFSNALRYIAENPLRWQSQANKFAKKRKSGRNRRAQHAAPLQRGRT